MTTALQLPDLSKHQLAAYAKLIYDTVGIVVSPQKATLLSNRLRRRLRATGIGDYDEYLDVLKRSPVTSAEWDDFLEAITTHETYLFRDEKHWDWLRNEFVPEMIADRRSAGSGNTLRVWSAACSTGDEAVTIACCLAEKLPKSGWTVDILGTDVGAGTVTQAQTLCFGERAMRLVPQHYRTAYFELAGGPGKWTPKAAIRKMLRFQTHNLLQPLKERAFDLVVLKNVLIYFDLESKRQVLENVRSVLTSKSYLVTGAAEGVGDLVQCTNSRQGWLHTLAADKK